MLSSNVLTQVFIVKSQTFVNLKYIQKLEISYEFDVHLIFTLMYGGFTDTHRRPLSFIDKRTLYWLFTQTKLSSIYRNKPIVTYTCIGPW